MNEQQVMICERARRAALRSIYALATGFGPPNLPPSLLSRSEVAAAILELPVVTRGWRQRRRVGTDAAARVVLGPFCVPIESSEPVQEAKDIDLAHAALANLAKMARESEHEASSVETWAARIKEHQFPAEVELDWAGDESFEPTSPPAPLDRRRARAEITLDNAVDMLRQFQVHKVSAEEQCMSLWIEGLLVSLLDPAERGEDSSKLVAPPALARRLGRARFEVRRLVNVTGEGQSDFGPPLDAERDEDWQGTESRVYRISWAKPSTPGARPRRLRGMNKTVQAKHVDERALLRAILEGNEARPDSLGMMTSELPKLAPDKVLRAKLKSLRRRGLVEGCVCGCRGDFRVTGAGREWLLDHVRALSPEAVEKRRLSLLEDPKAPADVAFTCDTCAQVETCAFAFDLYNFSGDCLAEK